MRQDEPCGSKTQIQSQTRRRLTVHSVLDLIELKFPYKLEQN